jgi:hypothetical protein
MMVSDVPIEIQMHIRRVKNFEGRSGRSRHG